MTRAEQNKLQFFINTLSDSLCQGRINSETHNFDALEARARAREREFCSHSTLSAFLPTLAVERVKQSEIEMCQQNLVQKIAHERSSHNTQHVTCGHDDGMTQHYRRDCLRRAEPSRHNNRFRLSVWEEFEIKTKEEALDRQSVSFSLSHSGHILWIGKKNLHY
jgi:hypothetical protein